MYKLLLAIHLRCLVSSSDNMNILTCSFCKVKKMFPLSNASPEHYFSLITHPFSRRNGREPFCTSCSCSGHRCPGAREDVRGPRGDMPEPGAVMHAAARLTADVPLSKAARAEGGVGPLPLPSNRALSTAQVATDNAVTLASVAALGLPLQHFPNCSVRRKDGHRDHEDDRGRALENTREIDSTEAVGSGQGRWLHHSILVVHMKLFVLPVWHLPGNCGLWNSIVDVVRCLRPLAAGLIPRCGSRHDESPLLAGKKNNAPTCDFRPGWKTRERTVPRCA